MDLKKIDPALELIKEFTKVTGGLPADIDNMRKKAIFTDGVLPKKYKAMAAVLWSVSNKCEPCFKYYIQKAKEFSITEEEVGEFLAIASTMGGCVGEMWALKAFRAFKDDELEASDSSCCS